LGNVLLPFYQKKVKPKAGKQLFSRKDVFKIFAVAAELPAVGLKLYFKEEL
jgi:hypothetical protein